MRELLRRGASALRRGTRRIFGGRRESRRRGGKVTGGRH